MKKKIIILILVYILVIVGGLLACQIFIFKPYACKQIQENNDGAEIKNAQECSLSILFDTLYGEI